MLCTWMNLYVQILVCTKLYILVLMCTYTYPICTLLYYMCLIALLGTHMYLLVSTCSFLYLYICTFVYSSVPNCTQLIVLYFVLDKAWLRVTVTDKNDRSPHFPSPYYTATIMEGSCDSNIPLVHLKAIDDDLNEAKTEFTFEPSRNPDNLFQLRDTTNTSTNLYCSGTIDLETTPDLKVVVRTSHIKHFPSKVHIRPPSTKICFPFGLSIRTFEVPGRKRNLNMNINAQQAILKL